jgi:6-phosphogluconolactonase (cycloisomerase 2 family)
MAVSGWCLRVALLLVATGAGRVHALPRTLESVGLTITPPLSGAGSVAVSSDGAHVYVGARFENRIVVLGRDAVTGALRFLGSEAAIPEPTFASAASFVALSPDGAHVYAVGDDAVVVLGRDAGTGALTFVEELHDGVGGVDGIDGAAHAVVSPDGAHVYVAGRSESALAVFSRNAVTGALTFVEVERDGVGGVDGLAFPKSSAVSPDGANVYVTSLGDDAVAVFSRDAGTGALAFVEVQRDGVGGVDGLDFATSVAVSPGGTHVYVTGSTDNAVAVFGRDAGTGALAFVEVQRDGVGGVDGLENATSVAVAPDGAHVYVTAAEHTLAVFSRDAGSGALTPVEVERDGVAGTKRLRGAESVALSPDGAHVYVAAAGDGAAVAFTRDALTGAVTIVNAVTSLDYVTGLAPSPDGAHVYAALPLSDAVAVFGRNGGTGALTLLEAHYDGLGAVDGLDGAIGVALSPDGAHAYVVSGGDNVSPGEDNAIAVFSRNVATGRLTLVEVQRDGVGGVDGLFLARAITVSPDGAHVYTASPFEHAVAIFSRNAGTGALTFVGVVRDGVGGLQGAFALALSPDGAHAYVAGPGESALAAFSRNALTGMLSLVDVERDGIGGVQGLFGIGSVVVSPDGVHVYAAGTGVVAFERNAGSGALGFVATLPGVSGSLGLGPAGDLLYAGSPTRSIDPSVSVMAREASTGRLTFVEAEGIPFAQFSGSSFAVSPDGMHVYAGGEPAVLVRDFAGCEAGPLVGCRGSSHGVLRLVSRGTLVWRWLRGDATSAADLGDPTTTTDYALCLYDESGPTPALLLRALMPAGGVCGAGGRTCWKAITPGVRYRDISRTPEGVRSTLFKTGGAGQARIVLAGAGDDLGIPALPLNLPVRAQLEADTGECWEATYSVPRVNTSSFFGARSD